MTFKTKNNFILQCSAYDYDSIQFVIEHNNENYGLYLSTLSSDFYSLQQYSPLKHLWFRIKLAFSVLFGKEYRLFELCVSNKDMKAFKQFVDENVK